MVNLLQARPTPRGSWGWGVAIGATFLNSLVVGYGAVKLQFFGASPDYEDYSVSMGGYGVGALLLLVAIPGLLARKKGRKLVLAALLGAATLAYLTFVSSWHRSFTSPASNPLNSELDGIGGVLWAPYAWALLVLGLQGVAILFTRSGSSGTEGADTLGP